MKTKRNPFQIVLISIGIILGIGLAIIVFYWILSMADNIIAGMEANNKLKNIDTIETIIDYYTTEDGLEYKGISVDVSYFDANREIVHFRGVPVEINIEIYAYKDMQDAVDKKNEILVYLGGVTKNHSEDFTKEFGNYIRIPFENIQADINEYVETGLIKIIIKTPHGTHEDSDDCYIFNLQHLIGVDSGKWG